MTRGKLLPILFFTALILILAVILVWDKYSKVPQSQLTTYQAEEKERPEVTLDHNFYDLGNIPSKPPTEHIFTVKNTGTKPLQVTNVVTSCGCTFAQFIITGKESPKFSMHDNPAWQGEIAPGANAQIKVIFDPASHNIQGEVSRQIAFQTNDPLKPQVTLEIKADVK